MHRDFKGMWVPAEIWLSKDLKFMQKMFLAEIDSLDSGSGCFASLKHFMELFNLSKSRCSELITSLCDGEYVNVTWEDNGRGGERRVLRLDPMFGKQNPRSENRTRGSENRTPIKDEKYNEKYNTTTRDLYKYVFTEKEGIQILTNTAEYVESIMSNNKLKKRETVSKAAARFVKFQLSIRKEYNNRVDFMNHFSSWTRSQGLVDETVTPEDIDAGVAWFIKVFNAISKKDYKVTPAIRELFAVQLGNGFTGDEMQKAIENLYSGQNTWHKKNKYVEATPEFLLANDRLNKFLNAKY